MARLKFLLFALVVLGLWGTQLFLLAPAVGARATEQASESARRVPTLVVARLDARRLELQRVAVKVAGSPALLAALPAPPAPEPRPARGRAASEPAPLVVMPDAALLRGVRGVVAPAVPESLRAELVLAVVNEKGAVLARGDEEPKALPEGLDAAALAKAGGDGLVAEAFGVTHVFHSFPLSVVERPGGPRTLANVVIGAPLVTKGMLPELAKETGVGAVALVKDGKRLASAGTEEALLGVAEKALKPGQAAVIARGQLSALGPLQLPILLTGDDFMGGSAPLAVGARQALEGTPFEVLAIASTRATLQPLASFQRLTLFGLAGLLGLTLIWTLIMGSGRAAAAGQEESRPRRGGDTLSLSSIEPPPAAPQQPAATRPPAPAQSFDQGAPAPDGAMPLPPPLPAAASAPPPSVAEADFFAPAGSTYQEPQEPVYQGSPPPAEMAETRAYPVPQTAFGAHDAAPGNVVLPMGGSLGDHDPTWQSPVSTATTARMSPVPDELVRATVSTSQPMQMPPAPDPQFGNSGSFANLFDAPDPDEQHFQDVFRDFIATRERCGEPADGLTYEKFVQKLRKNKEQLMQKYACRTVRFVVYVKEGKAALKATPVKE